MSKKSNSNGIPAAAIMAGFSSPSAYVTVDLSPERKPDPRGEPVEQWESGKWVTRWSKTGQEVRG